MLFRNVLSVIIKMYYNNLVPAQYIRRYIPKGGIKNAT